MAKQGRKLRNRSPISTRSEADISATKYNAGSSSPAEPEVIAISNPHGSANRGISGTNTNGLESFDNVHSPYFLHSADHPGLSIVSHTLDGSNYNNWFIAMRISLDAKNKLAFVDGSLPRPDESDSLFKIWSRCNSMVKSWVLNVVSKDIYDSILYCEDAAEMWTDLHLRFRVNNLPRKYQLEQAIYTLKQGHLDLSSYYTKKKTLWEQLSNTKTHSAKRCNCDYAKELLDEAETSKIIQFLMGLNDNFANIRGNILNMRPRPSLPEIYNMLDQDESQRLVGMNNRVAPAPAAFQIQETDLPDSSQILLAQGGFKKPKCSHCNKLGHTVDRCYKVHQMSTSIELIDMLTIFEILIFLSLQFLFNGF
ncbi:uncharacterized protein LOC112084015 [Eutrema salsugineum]|uniref:uncharacterized protein LOC112084015 n=1 Tax=Eutrema salsugineum TaxID=72664 RepID=UPI000CED01F3|nr:uncharacterized protein LOC112084015 [Eutrema salsugineum]